MQSFGERERLTQKMKDERCPRQPNTNCPWIIIRSVTNFPRLIYSPLASQREQETWVCVQHWSQLEEKLLIGLTSYGFVLLISFRQFLSPSPFSFEKIIIRKGPIERPLLILRQDALFLEVSFSLCPLVFTTKSIQQVTFHSASYLHKRLGTNEYERT